MLYKIPQICLKSLKHKHVLYFPLQVLFINKLYKSSFPENIKFVIVKVVNYTCNN